MKMKLSFDSSWHSPPSQPNIKYYASARELKLHTTLAKLQKIE
jgi:hypothetical protein